MTKRSANEGNIVVSQIAPEANGFFAVKNQIRSILFGLFCATAVLLVFLFVLFNEMVITPFIRPSQTSGHVPAVGPTGLVNDPAPKIRIPGIGVEIPVVYGLSSTDEKQFELALDNGVVHYPTTVLPGQPGNAAFFGHSSNNIFNPGKYKFAFVLLHELEIGEPFHLTYEGRLYSYEVIKKHVVKPTEVGVLGRVEGQTTTATLITCDPPGTSTNRLVVVGKQTSLDMTATDNMIVAAPKSTDSSVNETLPGNGPGLITRLWRSIN